MIDNHELLISSFRRNATLIVGVALAVSLLWGPFNVSVVAVGLRYMGTFFHELGHTAFYWLFGYPTLPSFDFEHGGGMAWYFDREVALQYGMLLAVACGVCFVFLHHNKGLGIVCGVLFLAYALASLTEFHDAVILFMGNGSEILMGSFILARVLFDAVPARPGELEIHALAGWFMVLDPLHLSFGLIFDPDVRDEYWHQKGAEGFGDFSRVANYFGYFGFGSETPVAWFCIGFGIVSLSALFLSSFLFSRTRQVNANKKVSQRKLGDFKEYSEPEN